MLNPPYVDAQQFKRGDWTPPEGDNVWHIPGFVDATTTYESHSFWIEFEKWEREPDAWRTKRRPEATLWVQHGGGVECIKVRNMFARPLRDMLIAFEKGTTPCMMQPAFFMCWGVFELARDAKAYGSSRARQAVYTDFANGRLMRRKVTGRDTCSVWVKNPLGWKDHQITVKLEPSDG